MLPKFSNNTRLKRLIAAAKNFYHWRVDRYLRYAPVISILKRENFRNVLEVGSGNRGITAFWPQKVKGLDLKFSEEPATGYLGGEIGTILNLPFHDGEYEAVICVDAIEHLKRAERERAIFEIIRVAGKLAVIAVPCGPKAEKYDRKLYSIYKKKVKSYHKWMEEHLEYGLPSCDSLVTKIKNASSHYNKTIYQLKIVDNCNLDMWLWLNKVLLAKNYHWFLFKNKLVFPFKDLLKRLNNNPYRKIFAVHLGDNGLRNDEQIFKR